MLRGVVLVYFRYIYLLHAWKDYNSSKYQHHER